jgi:hypothetical protein
MTKAKVFEKIKLQGQRSEGQGHGIKWKVLREGIPNENHKVSTITSKFHQNPTIPSEDNMLKIFSQSDTMQAH